MTAWAVSAALAAGCVFGAVMYRAGRKAAENEAYCAREKENEKMDEIMRSVSAMQRRELFGRLRGGKK